MPSREESGPGRVAGIALSSPDKILYQQAGVTKRGLAAYYESIADLMLPLVKNRPLTLVRCPQGHTRHCFFQKHPNDKFDPAVKHVAIEDKNGKAGYAYIDSTQGLVGLVQMGTLEIHAWGSRVDAPDKPDMLVFDMDPDEGVTWHQIKQGVRDVRRFLATLGLKSYLRTSGGKGLHVVVPLTRRHTWAEVKAFSKAVAQQMANEQPELYIATASKAKRKNKIFIDYLRNARGATSICSFSTRSRPGAPVATPVSWDELEGLDSPRTYQLSNILERTRNLPQDPWEGYGTVKQSITRQMQAALRL